MKTADFNNKLIQGYMELLRKLSTASKLELISRLKSSIKSDMNSNNVKKAFGAWHGTEDADELIAEIRSSRSFNRSIDDL